MPGIITPHATNNPNQSRIVITWRGRYISHFVTVRMSQESFTNFPSLFQSIGESEVYVLSMTIVGYNDAPFQMNLPCTHPIAFRYMSFQRLSRDDNPRGRKKSFYELVTSLQNRPTSYVCLGHPQCTFH